MIQLQGETYADTNCTIQDFNKIVKNFETKLGKHHFETGSLGAASKFCNELSEYHACEVVKFQDKEGNVLERGMSYIKDVKAYVKKIVEGRGIKNPQLVLGADSGQKKMIMTLAITEQDPKAAFCDGNQKPGSTDTIFLLAETDNIPEIYPNLGKGFIEDKIYLILLSPRLN